MSGTFVQNKYNAGDVVFSKKNPTTKLLIRRYIDRIYYCKVQDFSERKEEVYFERELVEDLALAAKNQKSLDETKAKTTSAPDL